MNPNFWHERWRTHQIGFHQAKINAHLQRFWPELKVPQGSSVLVPLCGKSLDLLWLSSQGVEVLGSEISAVATAAFFAENHLRPTVTRHGRYERWEAAGVTILCGNFFDLHKADLRGCSALYDRASLVALPAAMRTAYADHLSRILPTVSDALLISMEYPQSQMQGPPFSVSREEVHNLYQHRFRIRELDSIDLLTDQQQFRQKGVTRLVERVYHLQGLV
ncbi:MAG: thiopurine S-methyltransferase [Gammaproteobacteria bacterium]|nr:thiopurine S-methyltransferase [Gammaproteobacteria bacterium]